MAEYMYHISPLARLDGDDKTVGFRSVSDFLAIDNKTLLVIEKTFFTKPRSKNSVQLFLARKTPETTNVLKLPAAAGFPYVPLEKELLIDLDQFEGK